MTGATLPRDVAAYLEAVRRELADVSAEDREELLEDVEASVLEAAAEGPEVPLELRLGTPAAFAGELRAAAGLAPPQLAAAEPASGSGGVFSALRVLADRVEARLERFFTEPRRQLLHRLAPIWWVARGFLAVAILALLTGERFSTKYPAVPNLLQVAGPSLLLLIAAVAGSVWLGLSGRGGRLVIALNAVVLLFTLPYLTHVERAWRFGDPMAATVYYEPPVEQQRPEPGVFRNGEEVRNIYAFDRDGKPLRDVQLFDDLGRPLRIGGGQRDPDRRPIVDRRGRELFNVFPIRYFEPGTRRVARPNAAPPELRPRKIVTRPLSGR